MIRCDVVCARRDNGTAALDKHPQRRLSRGSVACTTAPSPIEQRTIATLSHLPESESKFRDTINAHARTKTTIPQTVRWCPRRAFGSLENQTGSRTGTMISDMSRSLRTVRHPSVVLVGRRAARFDGADDHAPEETARRADAAIPAPAMVAGVRYVMPMSPNA